MYIALEVALASVVYSWKKVARIPSEGWEKERFGEGGQLDPGNLEPTILNCTYLIDSIQKKLRTEKATDIIMV